MSTDTLTLWTVGPSVERDYVDDDHGNGKEIISHIVLAANRHGNRYKHVQHFDLSEAQPHPERRASKLAGRVKAAGRSFSPVNNRYWVEIAPRPGSPAAAEQEAIRQREEAEYEIRCQEAEAEAWGQVGCHAVTWVP